MTVKVNFREFVDQKSADRYLHGYNAYPMWPLVMIDGELKHAPAGSLEATGWYDADEVEQTKRDEMGEEDDD